MSPKRKTIQDDGGKKQTISNSAAVTWSVHIGLFTPELVEDEHRSTSNF